MPKKLLFLLIIGLILLMSQPALTADNAYINYSNEWVYTLNHEIRVSNNGKITAYDITISVPLMDETTPDYIDLLIEQLYPWPSKILVDENGHREAVYYIDSLAAGQSITIVQKHALTTYNISYNIDTSAIKSTQNGNIPYKYLEPETGIESDNQQIISFAEEAVGSETNPYLMAKKIFSAVNLHMTYADDENANKGALNALLTGRGVCEDYSELLVACLRAEGIPARQLSGYLFMPSEHLTNEYLDDQGRVRLNTLCHAWVEFYIEDIGWIVCDPTFTYSFTIGGQTNRYIDWNYFANIPNERRYVFYREGLESPDKISYSSYGSELTVDFTASLSFGSDAVPFNDIEGHWAESSIMYLYNLPNLTINGIGGGLYGVDNKLTRAQLVAMLSRIEGIDSSFSSTFTDVSTNYWAYDAIGAAQTAGWVKGYPDGSFRPDNPVTRAELAQVLVNYFQLSKGINQNIFTDINKNYWAAVVIDVLASQGVCQGYPDGSFRPNNNVTRGEAAAMLARLL